MVPNWKSLIAIGRVDHDLGKGRNDYSWYTCKVNYNDGGRASVTAMC